MKSSHHNFLLCMVFCIQTLLNDFGCCFKYNWFSYLDEHLCWINIHIILTSYHFQTFYKRNSEPNSSSVRIHTHLSWIWSSCSWIHGSEHHCLCLSFTSHIIHNYWVLTDHHFHPVWWDMCQTLHLSEVTL